MAVTFTLLCWFWLDCFGVGLRLLCCVVDGCVCFALLFIRFV